MAKNYVATPTISIPLQDSIDEQVVAAEEKLATLKALITELGGTWKAEVKRTAKTGADRKPRKAKVVEAAPVSDEIAAVVPVAHEPAFVSHEAAPVYQHASE